MEINEQPKEANDRFQVRVKSSTSSFEFSFILKRFRKRLFRRLTKTNEDEQQTNLLKESKTKSERPIGNEDYQV